MPPRLWIGGVVSAPLYVTEPVPSRPDLVAWIDTVSGQIVESEIVEPAMSATTLATTLSKALQGGGVRPPARLRVANVSLAEAVRTVVGESITVEVAPTPELAQVAESLSRFLDANHEDGPERSYLEDGRVPAATNGLLFETAARLYRTQPWNRLWDADTIGLDVPSFGLNRAVLSVIGRAGQNFGFIIFESAAAFDAFGASASQPRRHGNDLGASTLSLNFDTKSRLSSAMRQEITLHGWKVAGPRAYPHVMAVDRDQVFRPLRERDVLLVCAVAESLARFMASQGGRLSPEMTGTIVEEYTIWDQNLTVRFTAPHPEMPWFPDDPPRSDDEDTDEDTEKESLLDDEDATERMVEETTSAFVADQQAAGTPAEWLDGAGFIASSLLGYQVNHVGGMPRQLTEHSAADFLLDHFPRKVSADDNLIDATPEALIAFYDWLAARGTIPFGVAAATRARVLTIRNRFLAAARDPSRYGPAKKFVTAMHADGVDIADEAAVQRYLLRYNERITSGSAVASPDPPVAPSRPRFSPRWVPSPSEEPPDLKSPCPCGSGRRYGKCCMPR